MVEAPPPAPPAESSPPRLLDPYPWAPDLSTQRRILLALLLFALAALKVLHLQMPAGYNEDGWYYLEIARNVRDGLGLVSNVSLYHAGFPHFPHETPVYPAWPLLLGWVGRLVPLEEAARWLPALLYLGTLALAYPVVSGLLPGPLFPGAWPVLTAGHAFVLFLGTQRHFFVHTSLPYTEGLAFLVLFAFLGRVAAFFRDQHPWRALELGLWLGLLLMVRSQMFLATLALGTTLGWGVLTARPRVPRALSLGLVGLGFVLSLTPWWRYLQTFVPDLSPTHLLRFDAYRATDHLSVMKVMVRTDGPLDFLQDRARGVWVSMNPAGRYSWWGSFRLWWTALPVAAAVGLLDLPRLRVRSGLRRAWVWATAPEHQGRLFVLLLAAAGFGSLYTFHKREFAEWNFSTRHALTASGVFFLCFVSLARRPVLPRLFAVWLLCAGAYSSVYGLLTLGDDVANPLEPGDVPRPTMVTWLNERQAAEGPLVVVAADARRLANFTPGVGYHWIFRRTSLRDLERMFEALGADYLLVPTERPKHDYLRYPGAFEWYFERVAQDLDGLDVYRPRPR